MKKPDRFIVIDDDLTNNLLCRIAIKGIAGETEIKTFDIPEKGFEYIVSNYSKTGIEIPTILFLDINMPTWSGWDFLENFGNLDENIRKQIIIYMLSTSVDPRDKTRALENKLAVDYIEKPLSSKIVADIFLADKSDFGKVVTASGEVNSAVVPGLFKSSTDLIELKSIASQFVEKSFKKREQLFKEGGRGVSLYYIQEGKVKTFKTNKYAKELITGLHKPEDFLGYVSLLENSTYTETAEAMGDCRVSVIPREAFQKLVFENAEVNKKFIYLLTKNQVESEERMLALAYDSVRQRVAAALLQLQKKYNDGSPENSSMSFSREDLANIVGTATESLIRTLSDFKEDGSIEINTGVITIKDQSRLEKIIL